jgi:hypothetical protein
MRSEVPTGTVLAGFRVEWPVGEGGMGAVYLAEAPDGQRAAGSLDPQEPLVSSNPGQTTVSGGVGQERNGVLLHRATSRRRPPDRLRPVTTAVESGAQGVRWDLTPLAPSEEAMKERLEAAVADAAAFGR